ncbi:hypothetical protein AAK943_06245 [Emergencia timonensis]|nr:hypothetical protein [Emergencia timonensis]WNX89829.1 hypothetical protein RVY71_06040 [Emergencia timonensis]
MSARRLLSSDYSSHCAAGDACQEDIEQKPAFIAGLRGLAQLSLAAGSFGFSWSSALACSG